MTETQMFVRIFGLVAPKVHDRCLTGWSGRLRKKKHFCHNPNPNRNPNRGPISSRCNFRNVEPRRTNRFLFFLKTKQSTKAVQKPIARKDKERDKDGKAAWEKRKIQNHVCKTDEASKNRRQDQSDKSLIRVRCGSVLHQPLLRVPAGKAVRQGALERTARRLVNQPPSIPSNSLLVIGAGSHTLNPGSIPGG